MKLPLDAQYNFAEREAFWRAYWEEHGVYKFHENLDKPIYAVDTPPPYVSADHLHAGHILSYSQAEFIVRYKRMKGFNVYYPMGFDDNGLPTERFVEKKYNVDKSKISRSEFIELCLKETKIGEKTYKNLWTDLGISVDWSKTYSTIDPVCQSVSQHSFIDLYKKGKVYRKNEPMLWCTKCQTALAQADLEDEEQESFLNFIEFNSEGKMYTIATTRPELLPACVALFANPHDTRYATHEGMRFTVPLCNYEVPLLFDEAVDMTFGTGLMMVCSWGDLEDIRKIKEHNLATRQVIDETGKMTTLAGEYAGLTILEAREEILEDLKEARYLTKQEAIKHIVNVHERCSTPVEFIPTTQWFIDILNIKKELLERGDALHWYPEFMKNKYIDWVNGLKWDWCISRQRYYGVPFPLWYCCTCGEIILADETKLPVDPMESSPSVSACPKCGGTEFVPEKDVFDTWATSSSTPIIIRDLIGSDADKKKIYPSSLRPQAFEIIRTWLFYSVVKAHYNFDTIPFIDVMISGHGLDEKGRKISKRLGNYIEPPILLREYGADAIRYWATGATLGNNHRFNLEDIKKGKHTVNKLWNAAKLCSQYIDVYDPHASLPQLEPEDKWILSKLNGAIRQITEFFDHYEYAEVRTILDTFFWGTFCDYYLEMIKHRAGEQSVLYTLYTCLLHITQLYAPIFPYITEELYQTLFKEHLQEISIHVTAFPEPQKIWEIDSKQSEEIDLFIQEIDAIRKKKADLNLRYKDVLKEYKLQTHVNKKLFKEKLEKMLSVEII